MDAEGEAGERRLPLFEKGFDECDNGFCAQRDERAVGRRRDRNLVDFVAVPDHDEMRVAQAEMSGFAGKPLNLTTRRAAENSGVVARPDAVGVVEVATSGVLTSQNEMGNTGNHFMYLNQRAE
jgi:hypothetical protein